MKNIIFRLLFGFILLAGCGSQSSDTVPPEEVPAIEPIDVFDLAVSEPSGLFYRADNHTLYLVGDDSPYIYTLDTTGNILSRINTSLTDMEGITLSPDNKTIYVVKEGDYFTAGFDHSGRMTSSFNLITSSDNRYALEGITIDDENNFLLINEKYPCLLVKANAAGNEISRTELNYTDDISDIFYDKITESIWMVSDESKKLLQLNKSGKLIKQWKLPFKSAEGLAMSDTHIFICSDSETKLYIFKRP